MKFAIGVLGATGYIAAAYRREIRESVGEASLVALCARRRDLLDAAAAEDGALLATDDWRAVVEHPQVNTVLVATPDALHYEPVLRAAALGKHVVCEKPVGVDVVQARAMWEACRDAGVGHFVPFWTRYVPVFMRARQIVAGGTLGEVRSIVMRWHNPRPLSMPFTWRDDANLSSAGSIADVGSHVYDTLRWLLGLEASRVLVHAGVIAPAKPDLGPINLDEALKRGEKSMVAEAAADLATLKRGTAFDYATIAFELANGAVGTVMLSHAPYLRKGFAPDVELHGTKASLAVRRIDGRLELIEPGGSPRMLETIPDPGFGNRFAKRVFPALRARAAGQPCEHPGLDEGLAVQCFTDAAARSARQGTWVEVGETVN